MMDQDEERDAHEKRDRDTPAPFFARRQERARDGVDSASKPERQQENPMRFFETARATPRPSHLDKAWEQVRVVFTPMQEKATGRTASPDDLKDAASAVMAVLARHFPEGPKGAARAHRQFANSISLRRDLLLPVPGQQTFRKSSPFSTIRLSGFGSTTFWLRPVLRAPLKRKARTRRPTIRLKTA
jgi:hypothetical protein